MEKDLCKNVRQAPTPHFPVPGRGTPGTCLDTVHRNKPSFVSQQWAGPPLSLSGTGGLPGHESPPVPTEKGVSRLFASLAEPAARPLQTPKYMKVQIQFISAYISAWTPSQVPIFPVWEIRSTADGYIGNWHVARPVWPSQSKLLKQQLCQWARAFSKTKKLHTPLATGVSPLQWDIRRYKQVVVTCLW